MAGEQRAVAAEHGYRPALLQCDRLIKLLEISNVDCGEHDADEVTVASVDAPRQKKRPGAGDPADGGSADEDPGIVMSAQMPVIIPVGEVDGSDRPNSRAVDEPAFGSNQSDSASLREVGRAVVEKAMHLLARHQALELIWPGGPGGEDHGNCVLQDQVYRLHRACRLLGENDAEIGHLLPGVLDRIFASVPYGTPGGNQDNDEQRDSRNRKATAGGKLPTRTIEAFHRQISFYLCKARKPTKHVSGPQSNDLCLTRSESYGGSQLIA